MSSGNSLSATFVERRLKEVPVSHSEWVSRALFNMKKGWADMPLLLILTEATHWHAEWRRKRIYERVRRAFDFTIALIALILCSPVLLACAIAIKVASPGPVFFRQLRAGHFGRPFWILKFRTMPVRSGKAGSYLKPMEKPSPSSISGVGGFLRNHKLDELPQLWNVLKGDMALVGPRPFSMNDTATTPPEFYMRFAVKPGITGLWQATISNDSDGTVKLKYDCQYVRERGWKLDLFLLIRTFRVVFLGERSFSSVDLVAAEQPEVHVQKNKAINE